MRSWSTRACCASSCARTLSSDTLTRSFSSCARVRSDSERTVDCLRMRLETRPSLARSSLTSRSRRACSKSASTVAATERWLRRSVSRRARKLAMSASDARSWVSASSSCCCSCGSASSRITVSAVTSAPGRRMMRSTRPCVAEASQRRASSTGTSVPRPRTWRNIAPRFTVSTQTVARSTEGAAGLRRDSATETPTTSTATTAPMRMRLRLFSWATDAGR